MVTKAEKTSKVHKITVGLILSWLFGVLFIVFGFAVIAQGLQLSGIIMILFSVIIIPYTNKLTIKKFNFEISGGLKFLLAIIVLILWFHAVFQNPTSASCTPDWQCGAWSECISSKVQIRTCEDLNKCGDIKNKPSESQSCITYYENYAPYSKYYCDKIDPYDLTVRMAASDAIKNHPGGYSINQLFDIYDWIKLNIAYQNVPLSGIPYSPEETLATKSGDCKNQAVLITSMIKAIGGNAKVVLNSYCQHSYAMVYLGTSFQSLDYFTKAVSDHYGKNIQMNYFTYDTGIWTIFDPAGGKYPGNTLAECSASKNIYLVTSCLGCINQNKNYPYTYNDECYSRCPSGTLAINDYACEA